MTSYCGPMSVGTGLFSAIFATVGSRRKMAMPIMHISLRWGASGVRLPENSEKSNHL